MKKLFYNGKIHTMQGGQVVNSLLVENGVVTAQNLPEDDLGAAGAERVDLGGRPVLPGFHDSHLHLIRAGLNYKFGTY